MTKREIVWLIVKLIGVYFIYEAAMSAWNLLATFFTLISVSDRYIGGDDTRNFLKLIAWAIAMMAFHAWIGWYLINDGRLLFQILNREEPASSPENLKED